MKWLVFEILCLTVSYLAASPAEDCDQAKCAEIAGNSCYCSQTASPIPTAETPQLITLTYGDAIVDYVHQSYLKPLFDEYKNPDGAKIGGTIYVPHEWTDYERVNELYNMGLEIAVHSISKDSRADYWRNASLETLVQEMCGQKQILSKYANIPSEEIVGAKVPNLQMSGDALFQAYQQCGIQYDNSWTSRAADQYFPYSLHYKSSQPCIIGSCPTESYPDIWEVPIVDLISDDGADCNSMQSCHVTGKAADVSAWLKEQFQRVYSGTKAPMTLWLTSGWLIVSEENIAGLKLFLDELKAYKDVFLVSHKQVLDWMKDRTPASEFKTNVHEREQSCDAQVCALKKGEETRYMKSCVNCPLSYPWLDNPLGE